MKVGQIGSADIYQLKVVAYLVALPRDLGVVEAKALGGGCQVGGVALAS
jgi:hypothetical protein